ncbi:response regulator [Paenibacillus sp. NEAU-GSW1]|uniref:response regulator transcription factor n=1 Tax=Paenibacillus sp. NEAU-GSW1 TaxID=2682486 RepID=UPI0012E1BC27|nr:response regulator [Paenibacillus sp. NEAU-GSW1]MUT67183.1 response regulator [Paenibacillus sp. NEAU-GSW1]
MKKIMLVDDEILFRESVRNCIDWEREGFIYCGDASDGELALPIIEREQPDILLTDIKMPFMDGLELSAFVRQKYPQIKVVIMSGHDEFEYARAALRLGVEEYCLKPISSADIIRMLRDIGGKIDKAREEREQLERLRMREHEQAAQSKEKLLSDICNGFISTAEALQIASTMELPLSAGHYAVAIADIRCASGIGQADANQEAIWLERLAASLSADVLSYKRSVTEFVWLVKGESRQKLEDALRAFRKEAEQLPAEARDTAPCTLYIGAGTVVGRLQEVHASYLEAEEDKHWSKLALQNRHALHTASVGNGAGDRALSDQAGVFLDRNAFVEFLKIGDPSQTDSFIVQFTEKLKPLQWPSSSYGYYILNDLTLEVFHAAKGMFRHIEPAGDALIRLQGQIAAVRTYEEAKCYLSALCEQFRSWRSNASDRYADLIASVKGFIQSNFSKDGLSLQDAASFANISPSHLSKVFSQETGQTFIEYLTLTRIRKAMELLQGTSARTYEVAFQVGYNDAHYFSNLFRRVTGMTTRDFRKQGQGQGLGLGGASHDQTQRAGQG